MIHNDSAGSVVTYGIPSQLTISLVQVVQDGLVDQSEVELQPILVRFSVLFRLD